MKEGCPLEEDHFFCGHFISTFNEFCKNICLIVENKAPTILKVFCWATVLDKILGKKKHKLAIMNIQDYNDYIFCWTACHFSRCLKR